jgi:PRC-barrel domain
MALRTTLFVVTWAGLGVALLAPAAGQLRAEPPGTARALIVVAQVDTPQPAEPAKAASQPQDDSPEAKMNRRFPQKIRVGDLIGLPVLDDNDVTLGRIREVVRDPHGKVKLIVSYSRWFGWWGRPVAVPIEVVAILGRQLASIDMEPPQYAAAPTWSGGEDHQIPDSETIRIAITRR